MSRRSHRPGASRRYRRAVRRAAWLIAAVLLLTAACSSGAETVSGARPSATASGAASLAGICPETVTIQSNWYAQAEDGAIYRLLGGDLQVDKQRKRVTGSLVADGVDTGVKLQIRSGGPANGFVPAASVLYTDPSVLLATADTDQVMQLASTRPVKAVVAPLERSPVVLMFDPAQHSFRTIADIGRTDTRVLYFQGATYMEHLVDSGQLKRSQVDAGYAGTPDRWVASRGSIVQQGFVTNEVLRYEADPSVWGKKVDFQLVADSGYPVYPETLSIRPDRKDELAPCLKKLVPIMQRSDAAFAKDPSPTSQFISDLVSKYPKAFPYSKQTADASVKAMLENQILGNGRNKAIGDFDMDRVKKILNIVTPIFAAQKTPVKAGITADQLVTNEFIDPNIGMDSGTK